VTVYITAVSNKINKSIRGRKTISPFDLRNFVRFPKHNTSNNGHSIENKDKKTVFVTTGMTCHMDIKQLAANVFHI
jgi:hypothetical protein